MEDILNTILQDTFSLTQLKHRLRLLKTNLLKTFFGSDNQSNLPPGQTDLSLSAEELNWLKKLPEDFYKKFNKDNVYKIFSDIDERITKLPTLTMYLTFEPDDTILSQIGTYARTSFGPTLLLDIKTDPNLVAGTALVWKGIRKDYSLHAKIVEKQDEIFQEFKKFLR